ncbi:SGNH/GDSL hydrolase family protein [Marivirga aurantiaca]|nr:SGNH/GDSL hydrolase family protein [Marivirga aurantiaca]
MKLMSQNKVSYLALGDSYTIGESVDEESRWPVVLTEQLNEFGLEVELKQIIATTGWTTDELLAAIDKGHDSLEQFDFGLVSLLIGVNNQYRGYPIAQYEKEFEGLLKKSIQLSGNRPDKVFVVSIPDYGITPFAAENNKDSKTVTEELFKYNTIAREIALKYKVHFYDITPLSLKAVKKPKQYLATDQLHPSAKMYSEWVDYMAAGVYQQLK